MRLIREKVLCKIYFNIQYVATRIFKKGHRNFEIFIEYGSQHKTKP